MDMQEAGVGAEKNESLRPFLLVPSSLLTLNASKKKAQNA